MYRPGIRMDNVYKEWVDELFHASKLDRNQIFRLALFVAAHSNEFRQELEPYMKPGKAFPVKWQLSESDLWQKQQRSELNEQTTREADLGPVRRVGKSERAIPQPVQRNERHGETTPPGTVERAPAATWYAPETRRNTTTNGGIGRGVKINFGGMGTNQ